MKRWIGYWATTGLVGFVFGAGGVIDIVRAPAVMATLAHLGYPPYLATILGGWKILGAVAILAPKLPRLKEWAYAGIVFNLTGAIVSHLTMGDGIGGAIIPAVLLGLAALSWLLRPDSRILHPSATRATADARSSTSEAGAHAVA